MAATLCVACQSSPVVFNTCPNGTHTTQAVASSGQDAGADVWTPPPLPTYDDTPVPVHGRIGVTRGLFGTDPLVLAVGHCDDDATLDVLVLGANYPGMNPSPMNPMNPEPSVSVQVYFGHGDGTFASRPTPSLPSSQLESAIFLDVDNDGREDLVTVSNDVEVFHNLGGCTFAPPVTIAGMPPVPAGRIVATDVDLDGVTDFALIGDTETSTPPYEILMGQGDGSYVPTVVPTTPLSLNANGIVGFAAFFEDVDGDGARDLFAMNDHGEAWFSWCDPVTGRFTRDDRASVAFASADPMSLTPLDYNGDGVLDYFVAGNPGRSLLIRSGDRNFTDNAYAAQIEGTDDNQAWGAWAFDADLDGTPDVLLQRMNTANGANTPGPTEIYLNHGTGTFYNGGQSLIGTMFNGKSMACGDLSGAAYRGCLLMDPGGPVLFTDDITPRGNWLGLRLRGTVSAPDATGAQVSVPGPNHTVYYYGAQVGNGAAHDPSIVFGVGTRAVTDIDIRWPSGILQHVGAVPSGQYTTLTEVPAVTLSSRTAHADGVSTVTVTVTPAMANASQASLTLTGVGTLTQTPTTHGIYTWTVTAPRSPGEALLTVSLDNHPLAVRPRVRFTL